jgi:hypothetical protein
LLGLLLLLKGMMLLLLCRGWAAAEQLLLQADAFPYRNMPQLKCCPFTALSLL